MSATEAAPGRAGQARVRRPVLAALAVLLTGYVPLLSLWRFGHHPAGLPGLFSYRVATWGDGFALPLLALFLGVLTERLAGVPRRWPTWAAAAAGAAVGAGLIVTWWADPHPLANWTLVRPHHFTLPGVWHAVFLVAGSAFFAGSWVD